MTKSVLIIVENAAFCTSFLIAIYRINKANLDRLLRYKQFLLPITAVIYTIVMMLLYGKVKSISLALLKLLPEKISEIITPEAGFIVFAMYNILALSIFVKVKKLYFRINRKIEERIAEGRGVNSENFIDSLLEIYANVRDWLREKFYYYYEDKKVWLVKDEYGQMRIYLHVFLIVITVILMALVMPSEYLLRKGLLEERIFPAYFAIIFGELFCFINGLINEEYNALVASEEDSSTRIGEYHFLRDLYRILFSDKIIADNTTVDNAISDSTNQDFFDTFSVSNDPKEVAFGKYYEKINAKGFEIDHNYLLASLDLLNGKSILFNNPFYNDFSPYVFYPMNRALLNDRKVLIVLGRHSIEEDIRQWVTDGLTDITDIPDMWKIDVLGDVKKDCNVGIISRSHVNDYAVQKINSDFLKNVDFVVIIEPSKLLSTAQVGLNTLIKTCKNYKDRNITFCAFDKNSDGLVDSLSHMLMNSFSEVSSTDKHTGSLSYVSWNVDTEHLQHRLFNDVSRYLGVGTELSFMALKNQISKTEWYGGEVFPVSDMSWIDRQYYKTLLDYADLPTYQEVMDEVFETTPNYWSARKQDFKFMTVEDESYNMFEIMRNFATRSNKDGFINIISSDYLFKDYMGQNYSIFENDAKAIPTIAPDYARTGRNVALKLIVMLASGKVEENVVAKELSIYGITPVEGITVKEQLWFEIYNCFTSSKDVNTELPYEDALKETISKKILIDNNEISINIIEDENEYNPELDKYEKLYFIRNEYAIRDFIKDLQSASYITEDEVDNRHYLGSELLGNVFQKILPGQFFTFNGKYYEMEKLTGNKDVLVKRAADHITGRPTYRQHRKYIVENIVNCSEMGSIKDVGDFAIVRKMADITVDTDAYFKMNIHSDFNTSKRISVNGVPQRNYKNKRLLEIKFPEGITAQIKYTLTVLLNESFRSFFADDQEYIVAVTSYNVEEVGEYPLTYEIGSSESSDIDNNSIYIIEDNQMDIGLLLAVERNIKRFFETIFDYLNWHMEYLEYSKKPVEIEKVEEEIGELEPPKESEKPKKKKKRLLGFLRRKKKKTKDTEDTETKEKEDSSNEDETPKVETDSSVNGIPEGDEKEDNNSEEVEDDIQK